MEVHIAKLLHQPLCRVCAPSDPTVEASLLQSTSEGDLQPVVSWCGHVAGLVMDNRARDGSDVALVLAEVALGGGGSFNIVFNGRR